MPTTKESSTRSVLERLLPKALDERRDPGYKEWKHLEEKWDQRIPRGGFISDFVYYNRGNEAPTAYAIWAGLVAVSAAVRKKGWMKWDRGRPMCPNLYVILIGPPGLCKKGTIMAAAGDIVERFPERYQSLLKGSSMEDIQKLEEMMRCKVVRDKATPEALIRVLSGTNRVMVSSNGGGQIETENTGSQALVLVPELAIFLGKERYAQNMSNLLTRLYDGDDKFEYVKVAQDGSDDAKIIQLKDPFLSFLAGTTEGSFRDSVSEEAKGGGLLSRTIIISINETARVIARPFMVELLPEDYYDAVDEMADRLAWVALNSYAHGEYHLSNEADEFYVNWYRETHKPRISTSEEIALIESRADIHLLKTSMLLRAARYKVGNMIELQDIEAAMELLTATKGTMLSALRVVDSVEETRNREVILRTIRVLGEVPYRSLCQRHTRVMRTGQIKEALVSLAESGLIRTVNIKTGDPIERPSGRGHERYEYCGGTVDG